MILFQWKIRNNYRKSYVACLSPFTVLLPFQFSIPNPYKKCSKFVIFSVFSFGCLGRNLYLCSDFVTC